MPVDIAEELDAEAARIKDEESVGKPNRDHAVNCAALAGLTLQLAPVSRGVVLWQGGTEMPQIKMSHAPPQVVKTYPVIASPPDEPLIRGEGDTDYICAGSDRVIAENIVLGEIKNLIFECSRCGTSSEVP